MPAPKIPRRPIPKFTKSELNVAETCARALWYGIDFRTGEHYPISDAGLLSTFAPNFYYFHKQKKRFVPDIFVADVKGLILACGVKQLFRGNSEMDFRKAIDSIYRDIYPRYLSSLKNPTAVSSVDVAIECLELLSKGLVIDPKKNRLNLASRILFFLSPNIHCFNMNNSVAKSFGLQSRPHHHYEEFFHLFSDGLVTNQTRLSSYKIPPARDGLDDVSWNEISRTDWWKRRVLDLAVLIHTSPNIQIYHDIKRSIRAMALLDVKGFL